MLLFKIKAKLKDTKQNSTNKVGHDFKTPAMNAK